MIYLAPTHLPDGTMLPPSYTDAVSRTEGIVRVLKRLLAAQDRFSLDELCVRICAAASSFAISGNEPQGGRPPELRDLYLKERSCLVDLLNRGASFKIILTWPRVSSAELRNLSEDTLARYEARLSQLVDFCSKVQCDQVLWQRFSVIRLPIGERNLLFLGEEYFFEGRKMHMGAGFEATRVVTDPDEIRREIQAFDALFESGIQYACKQCNARFGASRNYDLLGAVIQDLNEDVKRLGTERGCRGRLK